MKDRKFFEKIFNDLKPELTEIYNFSEDTCRHSIAVAYLTYIFSQKISSGNISEQNLKDITVAGFMHDYGKLDCPQELINGGVYNKKEDRKKVEKHAIFTEQRLTNMIGKNKLINENVKIAASQHHECENGRGYPYSLKSEQISFFAKILHIIDIYEALAAERSYKKGYSEECTLTFMLGDAKIGKIDNDLFKKFIYMTSYLDLVNAQNIAENLMDEIDPDRDKDKKIDVVISEREKIEVYKTYNEGFPIEKVNLEDVVAYRFLIDKKLAKQSKNENKLKISRTDNESIKLENLNIKSKPLQKEFIKLSKKIPLSKLEKVSNLGIEK